VLIGNSILADKDQLGNQNLLFGCGMFALAVVVGLGIILALAIRQDRRAAQYPGAVLVSSHQNYTKLPNHFRWDNAYRTTDPFPAVYNWYSVGFDLGAEARANGRCILLEGSTNWLVVERYVSVLLCDTPAERMIFVARSTSLR
jgi:hypothetical protein